MSALGSEAVAGQIGDAADRGQRVPRKLLVINQYYPPDTPPTGMLAAEICEALAASGVEVHVLTGQPSYEVTSEPAPEQELLNGVWVHRISLGGARGRERMRVRLAGYLRFLWGAWWSARRLVKRLRPDGLITFHNPPFVGAIAALLARRRGYDYSYILHDIHPDILIATRWIRLPALLFWLWERLHRWIMRGADRILVLGEGMKRTLVEGKAIAPERVHVIPLAGYSELTPGERLQPIRREIGVGDDELMLLYAGNMGVMHPLDEILDAAAALASKPIHFVFCGAGVRREELVERVQREGLKRVSFLPFQPEARFEKVVQVSDLCFVTLQPGMERYCVPGKSYTYLSAGKPIIAMMSPEADISQLVEEAGCGWTVSGEDELVTLLDELVQRPKDLSECAQRAASLYDARFRRTLGLQRYVEVLTLGARSEAVESGV